MSRGKTVFSAKQSIKKSVALYNIPVFYEFFPKPQSTFFIDDTPDLSLLMVDGEPLY